MVMVDRIDRLGDAFARRSPLPADRPGERHRRYGTVTGGDGCRRGRAPTPTGGALLQEAIDVAVILNALRALRPGRRQHVALVGDDLALTRRFRAEHLTLRPEVDHLLAVADQIGVATPDAALALVTSVHRFLVDDLLPHEQAEDTELYPALARVLGGDDPTGTMSRGHAEIAHLTHRLGRLLADVDTGRLEGDDMTDARRLLYGLHAVLQLHFSQEDEGYFSLADDEPAPGARPDATGTAAPVAVAS